MDHFRVRPLSEADFDEIVNEAGGNRAHADAHARLKPGADFLLGEALLELKSLDDDGLAKPERQTKLAALFREHQPDRPVVVLDRESLPNDAQYQYDRALEGPIKKAVAKASKQLKQSRSEHPAAGVSVLVVVNNGYTALDHAALLKMVAHRARQDTEEIDGVVVAGCYFYSDTIESYFEWPIDYIPINISRPFKFFEALRASWNDFSERFTTQVLFGAMPFDSLKGPVIDTQFEVEGVTYVKPAPPMSKDSDFFIHGRPRKDSTGLKCCPAVARTFPDLTCHEWESVHAALPDHDKPCETFEGWMRERTAAFSQELFLKPWVPVRVACDGWLAWCQEKSNPITMSSLAEYANDMFEQRIRSIFNAVRERTQSGVVPSRYVLVTTEEIGQDKANDVSHIAVVTEQARSGSVVRGLIANARICHEHGLKLACAWAVRERIDMVMWQKNLRYAWI